MTQEKSKTDKDAKVRKINIALIVLKQRIKENICLSELALLLLGFLGVFSFLFLKKHRTLKIFSQIHRSTRLPRLRLFVEPFILKNLAITHQVSEARNSAGEQIERYLGKRMLVLKLPRDHGEKGVLYIMFSELFGLIPKAFDMEKLLKDYRLVLEPSWSGYCHNDILHYTKYKEEIYISAAEEGDFHFISRLNSNLKPLSFGPCDWVDDRLFEACCKRSSEKVYDIVMNSHWGWSKRHYVLFKTLKNLPTKMRVALIGSPWGGGTLKDVKDLAIYYGVDGQIDYFENIPYQKVIEVVSMCKLGILLSLKEGSNRAIAECLFADVPCIVLGEHVGGIKKNINLSTGRLVPESQVESAIWEMSNNLNAYSPREWALKNISCLVTTKNLNDYLKNRATACGEPWTEGIAVKTNSPELKYYHKHDEDRLGKHNKDLKKYFKS